LINILKDFESQAEKQDKDIASNKPVELHKIKTKSLRKLPLSFYNLNEK